MTDPPKTHPLPIRPVLPPASIKRPRNIAEYIARVNAEDPNAFREIGRRHRLGLGLGPGPSDASINAESVESPYDETQAAPTDKDLTVARNETLRHIDNAHNAAASALDTVSLLLTKEMPVQASTTLRPELRDRVGIGTLGAHKVHETNITPEKKKDDAEVAIGLKLMEIDKTRDAAAKAAAFLEAETQKEALFWDDILAIKQNGWAVCRLPQESYTLGVKFGFTEATPRFQSVSVAPLRSGDDGRVQIDVDSLGSDSQQLLVTLEKDGELLGRSTLPEPLSDDLPLEARVLQARNTIFSQELWHELQIEARSLLAYNVKSSDGRLVYTTESKMSAIFQLVSPEDQTRSGSLPLDTLARSIYLSLHLLLEHAHRQAETSKSRPAPPHVQRNRGSTQHQLLRPIIAWFIRQRAAEVCVAYIGGLVRSLRAAGISEAGFTLRTARPESLESHLEQSAKSGRQALSQALIANLMTPAQFIIDVTFAPYHCLSIIAQTSLEPPTGTTYEISVPDTDSSGNMNLLGHTYPPYTESPYPSFRSLMDYVRWAAACAVTSHCHTILETSESAAAKTTNSRRPDHEDDEGIWFKNPNKVELSTKCVVTRKMSVAPLEHQGAPMLRVTLMVAQRDAGPRVYTETWPLDGAAASRRTLADVCEELVRAAES